MPGVVPIDLPVVKKVKWANTQLGQWTAPVVNNGVLYHSLKHSGFGAYDFTTGSKRWGVLPDWHVLHQIIARDRIFAAAWRMSSRSQVGQTERDRLFAFKLKPVNRSGPTG